ncbi:hypothetical protein KWS_0100600, partial [Xanthomonas vasicola pv. musacearum NCPPB 4384]
QSATHRLRRLAAAVAGSGIGGLVFALMFASPATLENGIFLTASLPFAVLMIVVGLWASAVASKKPATDAEKAMAEMVQGTLLAVLQTLWQMGAALLLIGVAGWIGMLAILAFIVLELIVATVLGLVRRYR